MRFVEHTEATIELACDTDTPRTRWTVRALAYPQICAAKEEAGYCSVRGLTLHSLYHLRGVPREKWSAEEREAYPEHVVAGLPAEEQLSADDRAALLSARMWLLRYSYCVAVQGLVAVDDEQLADARAARAKLDAIPSRLQAQAYGELSNKIADLGNGDAEKKEPSESQLG